MNHMNLKEGHLEELHHHESSHGKSNPRSIYYLILCDTVFHAVCLFSIRAFCVTQGFTFFSTRCLSFAFTFDYLSLSLLSDLKIPIQGSEFAIKVGLDKG